MNAVARRTVMRILILGIALSMLTSSFVSMFWLHHMERGTAASLVVAMLPMPFFIGSFASMFWIARQCDELQRRVQFEALAFAYPLSLVLIMGVRMVRVAGFEVHFDMSDLFLAMALLYAAGLLFAWNRYR